MSAVIGFAERETANAETAAEEAADTAAARTTQEKAQLPLQRLLRAKPASSAFAVSAAHGGLEVAQQRRTQKLPQKKPQKQPQ